MTTTDPPPTTSDTDTTTGPPGPPAECVDTVEAAEEFIDSLDKTMAGEANFAWDDAHRTTFEFLPIGSVPRMGLDLRTLSEEQLGLLDAFLQAAFSQAGYDKEEAIRDLEADRDTYFISFFGTPNIEDGTAWGWKFEGHHLTVHNSMVDCEQFAATPAFWGANPDLTPIQDEVDLAIELWDALDGTQQGNAMTSIGPDAVDQKVGLIAAFTAEGEAAGDMSDPQVTILRDLVAEYVDNMNDAVAQERMEAIESAGFDDIYFSYDPGNGNWRVLGPTFLIEFIYSDATHVHSVWRDYEGDYGEDLIAKHLSQHPH